MALEGSGVQSWTGGGVGMNWLVVLTLPNCFDLPFSSQGDLFLWSLKNMSVSFRVKDQCQAAFHCPVYSWVAQAEVQPAVGVRGGVTARSGPLSLWPPFGKSAQISKGNIFPVATPCCS